METAPDRIVIDTDVLVDVLRNVRKVVNFIDEMEKKRYLLSTTIINAFELFYGAYKSKKRTQNLTAIRRLLDRLVILKIGLKSAEKAGHIHAKLEAKGQPIGMRDVMIGAIASAKGYSLVTRNIEHLQKIKDLALIAAP